MLREFLVGPTNIRLKWHSLVWHVDMVRAWLGFLDQVVGHEAEELSRNETELGEASCS